MSLSRVWTLVFRDLRLGPRSPLFVWALLMPVLVTFLVQVVFLTLFDPKPRLALCDLGSSAITASVGEMEGIEVTHAASPAEVLKLLEAHDADAGLVLEPGFDEAVKSGERPELTFQLSGESLLSNRIVLGVTMIDLVRQVEARDAPVEVELRTVGEGEALPIFDLMVLFLVLFVLLISGIFVPAFLLVEEREKGTLNAVLVTPTTMGEVLLAKGVLGFTVAIPMAFLTLALNDALRAETLPLLAALAVGAVICIEVGLIYGTLARDAKTLYTLVKTLNLILVGPVIFYFFPDWPQWIAKLFPTWWFIDPLYQLALRGADFADVRGELLVALGVIALLVLPVTLLGRRMERQLA